MTPPGDAETWQERTALAWQRTGLGVLAVAGLLAHRAALQGRPLLLAVAGGVALMGLGVLGGLAPARRRRVRQAVATGTAATAAWSAVAATGVVVLTGVAALIAVVSPY